MKPILRRVIDKNGAEETIFTPSPMMVQFSLYKAEMPGATCAEVCASAGIDPQNPGRWASKYGSHFLIWLEEAVEHCGIDDARVLYRVGMAQAMQPGNYQYFRDFARTLGIIKDEVKVQNITINTDFSQILIACGGDLERARSELLQKARGVVIQARPGVALPIDVGQPGGGGGAGDRVSQLQGESMALDDSLGADGGCATEGKPVPAISK